MKALINELIPRVKPHYSYEGEYSTNPAYQDITDVRIPLAVEDRRIWALRTDFILATGIKNAYHEYGLNELAQAFDEKNLDFLNLNDRYGHPSLATPELNYDGSTFYAGWIRQRSDYLEIYNFSGRFNQKLPLKNQMLLEAYAAKEFIAAYGNQPVHLYDAADLKSGHENLLSIFLKNKNFSKNKECRIYTPESLEFLDHLNEEELLEIFSSTTFDEFKELTNPRNYFSGVNIEKIKELRLIIKPHIQIKSETEKLFPIMEKILNDQRDSRNQLHFSRTEEKEKYLITCRRLVAIEKEVLRLRQERSPQSYQLQRLLFKELRKIEELNNPKLNSYIKDIKLLLQDCATNFTQSNFSETKSDLGSLNRFLYSLEYYEQYYQHQNPSTKEKVRAVFHYLIKYEELYSNFCINDKGVHLTKELTGLPFTIQIIKIKNEFQLFIRFKEKLENWRRDGIVKTVTNCLILKEGRLIEGADATIEEIDDKIFALTEDEIKLANQINSPDIHKVQSGVSFFHEKNKMTLYSLKAKGDLEGVELKNVSFLNYLIICSVSTRAVAATHVTGIIHQDIAAKNILLFQGEGTDNILWPKLSDFGFAL